MPPIAVFNATHDLLSPDGRRLRDKAHGEGADLAYFEYEGLFHVWVGVPIPEAARAIDEIARFVGSSDLL